MRYQRGALSLRLCAALVGLCASLAFTGLFSIRYGRNLFAEGWGYVQSTSVGQAALHTQSAAASALRAEAANTLRKCKINGAVVYSNVNCRDDNPTSRQVELHDNRGFESPKAPIVATPQITSSDNLQQKAMDKAIENATGNQAE
jgi:hypothetical protein